MSVNGIECGRQLTGAIIETVFNPGGFEVRLCPTRELKFRSDVDGNATLIFCDLRGEKIGEWFTERKVKSGNFLVANPLVGLPSAAAELNRSRGRPSVAAPILVSEGNEIMVTASKSGRRLETALADTPEERLRIVLNQALDEALRLYVVNQFSVWMKDPTGQPDRARVGVDKAITAWQAARRAIDAMEV